MASVLSNIAKIPDLRNRLLFTFGLLAVFRLGIFIPSPGVDRQALSDFFANNTNTLFGLYEGVPLSERDTTHPSVLPDKISIFYRPIVREARRPERIREQVRITLLHEIAHFFGMDEDIIDDLGY